MNLARLYGTFHAEAKLNAAQCFPFNLTSQCQAPSLSPVPFQVSFRLSIWVLNYNSTHTLACNSLGWTDFITARTQGQSLDSVRPWAPGSLTALAQLTTFGSVTANQHGSQSPRYSNCLQAKPPEYSHNSEKAFQISVPFSKGFELLRWTGEILNSRLWLLKFKKKKTKKPSQLPSIPAAVVFLKPHHPSSLHMTWLQHGKLNGCWILRWRETQSTVMKRSHKEWPCQIRARSKHKSQRAKANTAECTAYFLKLSNSTFLLLGIHASQKH